MKKHVLVVEDEPGLLLALEDRLRQEGYEVTPESNGVRAEEKAKKGSIRKCKNGETQSEYNG